MGLYGNLTALRHMNQIEFKFKLTQTTLGWVT